MTTPSLSTRPAAGTPPALPGGGLPPTAGALLATVPSHYSALAVLLRYVGGSRRFRKLAIVDKRDWRGMRFDGYDMALVCAHPFFALHETRADGALGRCVVLLEVRR